MGGWGAAAVKIRAVLTDLDGTLLEPDGSVRPEPLAMLARLRAAGVRVFAVTSKTAAEIAELRGLLGLDTPAGFENGAGVIFANGTVEVLDEAVPVSRLTPVAAEVRRATSAPLRTLAELSDEEVVSLTGLPPHRIAPLRQRVATLPLVVEGTWDEILRAALPEEPRVLLVRGNRFLYMQGRHEKTAVVPRLLAAYGEGEGAVVACGDAPNDAALLAAADVAVVVPGERGPHPGVLAARPSLIVAAFPHGRGWAEALGRLLDG